MDSIVQNFLILDIITALVIIVLVVVNALRGFSKTFISALGYILAIILGGFAGDLSAEPIYNSVLKEQITSNVQEVLDDNDITSKICDNIKTATYGVTISEKTLKSIMSSPNKVYNAINSGDTEIISKEKLNEVIAQTIQDELSKPLKSVIPGTAVDYMMNYLKNNSDELYTTASSLINNDNSNLDVPELEQNTSTAEYIEENFMRPIIIYIIKMAIFFIVFFIVMIFAKLMAKSVQNDNNLSSMASTTDRIMGAIMGLADALVLLLIVCVILKLLISSGTINSNLLTNDNIQSTFIFKYIYNINLLKLLN